MDTWELLNMDKTELAELAQSTGDYSDSQVRNWVQLVGAFRTIATVISHNLPAAQEPRFINAADQIRRIMVKYGGHMSQWRKVVGQRDSEGKFRTFAPWGPVLTGGKLFMHPTISQHIQNLFEIVNGPTRDEIMVCDYCGHLGPRSRVDQRYCQQACRLASYTVLEPEIKNGEEQPAEVTATV